MGRKPANVLVKRTITPPRLFEVVMESIDDRDLAIGRVHVLRLLWRRKPAKPAMGAIRNIPILEPTWPTISRLS